MFLLHLSLPTNPNYADLCRLWTTQEIIDWYGYITNVSGELKKEIALMSTVGKTPEEFGLKVRRHPDTLEITARNKMRYGVTVKRPVALNKIFIETPRLSNDTETLSANENLIRDFIDELKNFPKVEDTHFKNLWRDIPKKFVANLILSFQGCTWESFQGQAISEYIIAKMDDTPWDAVIPEGEGEEYDELTVGGKNFIVNPIRRTILLDEGEIKISGNNLRVGSPGTTRAGLTAEDISVAEETFRSLEKNKNKSAPETAYLIPGRRPLLVLYVIRPKNSSAPEILFALGVGFPAVSPLINEVAVKTADFVINAIGNSDDVCGFEYLDDDFDESGDDE